MCGTCRGGVSHQLSQSVCGMCRGGVSHQLSQRVCGMCRELSQRVCGMCRDPVYMGPVVRTAEMLYALTL